jgi:mycothiol synthase
MSVLPAHPALTWRPLQPSDFSAMAALFARFNEKDQKPEYAESAEAIEYAFSRPSIVLERDTVAGFDGEGELRAYGYVTARASATRMLRVMLWGDVDPGWRRQRIGTAVLRWSEALALQRIAELSTDLAPSVPRLIGGFMDATRVDRVALWRSAGFEPVRHFADMSRPIDEPPPEPLMPPGIGIVPWVANLDRGTADAHNDATLDHWGSEPLTPEQWRYEFSGDPAFQGDLSRIALDGDQVVGFAIVTRPTETDADSGLRVAWFENIGVRRSHRKRGIASALIADTLRGLQAAGIEQPNLGVDAANPSGAFGLYERLGFLPFRQNVLFGRYVEP